MSQTLVPQESASGATQEEPDGSLGPVSLSTREAYPNLDAPAQLLEALLHRISHPSDPNQPRPEYPRPQMAREHGWMNLNGEWEFEIDHGRSGRARKLQKASQLSGKITVPFCPESKLSGVEYTDFMAAVWYRKQVAIPEHWMGQRILLHIGACDYHTWVYIDGIEVGTHVGGYTPFTFDITEYLEEGESEVVVTICAEDDVRSFGQAKGKQAHTYESQGCDYTRCTGIWQTVWMEAVPRTYISSTRITPQLAAGGALVEARLTGDTLVNGGQMRLRAYAEGRVVGETVAPASGPQAGTFLHLDEVRAWSPEDPFLYDLMLTLEDDHDGSVLDVVHSYFGLRSIEMNGPAVTINGHVVFQRLVLDQGYYPEGIYTAPTDAALRRDIEIGMELGFNGARLHQKVFEPRYHYWADRMGYLTWGEMPDWGLDVTHVEGLAGFLRSWMEELERDYNHPSIVGWCPFNEHDSEKTPETFRSVYLMTKAFDATRPVIDSSGWTHVETDIYDVHDYDQNPATFEARYAPLVTGDGEVFRNEPAASPSGEWKVGQPYMVSEYGGIWWNPGQLNVGGGWGYGKWPRSAEEFLARYRGLTEALLNNPAMCGFCYTQLTDVEQEVNGLMFYDRNFKFDPAIIKAITSQPAAIELLINRPFANHFQRGIKRRQALAEESRSRISNRNVEFSPENSHTENAVPTDPAGEERQEAHSVVGPFA